MTEREPTTNNDTNEPPSPAPIVPRRQGQSLRATTRRRNPKNQRSAGDQNSLLPDTSTRQTKRNRREANNSTTNNTQPPLQPNPMAVIRPPKRKAKDNTVSTTTTATTQIVVVAPPPKRPKLRQQSLHQFFRGRAHDETQQQGYIGQDQTAYHSLSATPMDPANTHQLQLVDISTLDTEMNSEAPVGRDNGRITDISISPMDPSILAIDETHDGTAPEGDHTTTDEEATKAIPSTAATAAAAAPARPTTRQRTTVNQNPPAEPTTTLTTPGGVVHGTNEDAPAGGRATEEPASAPAGDTTTTTTQRQVVTTPASETSGTGMTENSAAEDCREDQTNSSNNNDPPPPPIPPATSQAEPPSPTRTSAKRPGQPTRHSNRRTRPRIQSTMTGQAPPESTESRAEKAKAEKARLFAIPFGEMTKEKPDGTARLCFGNMGPAGLQPHDESSVHGIRHFLRDWEVDHFGGVEHQVNGTNIPHRYRLPQIFRSENALRCIAAHNRHEDNHSYRQQGGTMAVTMGAMASRMHSEGTDSTGLGRWVWQLFKGKNGITTRLYTAYRPCKSLPHQISTVYAQQRRYFRAKGDERCPRDLFMIDLEKELKGRRLAGERLGVMMDANDDVSAGAIHRLAVEIGLRDSILSHHPTLKAPATHSSGSKTIDIIMLSPELQVEQATFLAGQDSPGDHRWGLVDIKFDVLLGEPVVKVVRPQARRLTCGLPVVKLKYTRYLRKHFKRHQLLEKLHKVQMERFADTELSESLAKQMTQIDRIREEGMRAAEKQSRKLHMGAVDFSPTLVTAGQRVELFKLIWKKKQGKNIKSTRLRRLAAKLKVEKPLSVTLEQAHDNFIEALRTYKKYKPDASVFRYDFLSAKRDDPNESEENRKAVLKLIEKERARDTSRQLKRVKNAPHLGAISKVEVPSEDADSPPTTMDTQDTVEKAIMDAIEERYKLSHQSPFLQDPLLSILGLTGNSTAAQQILDGTFICPDGVDDTTKTIVQLLQRPFVGAKRVDTEISRHDYQRYFKRVEESTSSSYSGLHFGHWKAAAACDELSEIHSLFTEIATTSGYTPPRWTHGLTVLLEKKPGVILVDKLRAILLLEGDFNFANKLILGIRMMRNAEAHNLTVPEALGSRKHHDAKELALNRRLLADISRQQVRPLAIASVDAAQCYDSIAHLPGSLACQRLGAPPLFMSCMLLTIQLMKFHIRTAYGDSDSYFSSTPGRLPLQGICQGNGAGPSFWYAVSIVLVILLHHKGHGAKYRSALSNEITVMAGLLFVDDTDLLAYGESSESIPIEVVEALQAAVLTWQQGLLATGGALKPEKCSWSLLAYWFKNGKPQIHTPHSFPASISLAAADGTMKPIERVPASEGTTVVGVVQTLNGKMKPQVDVLIDKAEVWATNIRNGWLNRRLAWTGLRTMIWPSLEYPLQICSMTEAQGDEIIRKLYKAMLPALGLNRKFAMIWRHAPRMFQGVDLPHPYHGQGHAQIRSFQQAGLGTEINGKLLRTTREQAQVEIGTSQPVLQENFADWGHLLTANCWIGSLWEFNYKYGITLEEDTMKAPEPQRQNDAYLMELIAERYTFVHNRNVKKEVHNWQEEWRAINRCRLFLQVMFLSDITSGDGKRIRKEYLLYNGSAPRPQDSKWEWPRQKPTQNDWSRWTSVLRSISSQSGYLDMTDHLGDWIHPTHQQQQWRYDPPSKSLFQYLDHSDVWKVYTPDPTVTGRTVFIPTSVWKANRLPLCLHQPIVKRIPRSHQVEIQGYAPIHRPLTAPPSSIEDAIAKLGLAAWPLQNSEWTHAADIAQAIKEGTAIGAADGSYMPKRSKAHGAAAWLLQPHAESDFYYLGQCNTSGTTAEVNAYRSELQGIHALLLALTVICQVYQLTSGSISLACDNETAVRHTNDKRLEVPSSVHHADLVRAIRRLRKNLPITVSMNHVYGHKDKHCQFHQLAPHEKLNCLADWDAKAQLRLRLAQLRTPTPPAPVPNHIYGEGIRCIIGGTKVTGNHKNTLSQHMYRDLMAKHLDEKGTLTYDAFELVNWEAMDKALQARSPSFCAWVTKHVSDQCAIGRRMKQWGFWDNDKCPCCEQDDETTIHLPLCNSLHMQEAYAAQLEKFTAWMLETDTDPNIASYFTQALQEKTLPTTTLPPQLELAIQAQQQIGWNNLLFGRVATKWMGLQEEHYRTTGSRRAAERWAADMTYRLLQFSHGLWMARNRLLHERDEQGLLLKEGQTLHDAMLERFHRGRQALLPADYHLIEHRSLALLLALPPPEKHTWLAAITLAHRMTKRTRGTEEGRMRTDLAHWLAHQVCRPVNSTTPPPNTGAAANTTHNNNNDDDDEA